MKKSKKALSVAVAVILLAAAATPAFAQSETEPAEEPPDTEEESGFWNPIVELLANFFAGLFTAPEPEETSPPEETQEGEETPEPGDTTEEPNGDGDTEETPEETPTPSPQEAVSALHTEQKLGFGEMTKLMDLAAQAAETCANEGENCGVTLDALVAEYKDGTGMGALFRKYGKPEMLGVGHVRKASNGNGKVKDKTK